MNKYIYLVESLYLGCTEHNYDNLHHASTLEKAEAYLQSQTDKKVKLTKINDTYWKFMTDHEFGYGIMKIEIDKVVE